MEEEGIKVKREKLEGGDSMGGKTHSDSSGEKLKRKQRFRC